MRHQSSIDIDRFLTQHELAVRWGCSPRTLQRWRTDRHGPTFVRLGGSIRYILLDVIAFEDRNRNSGEGVQ